MRDYSRSESNEYDEDEDDGMEDLAEEPKELPEVRGGTTYKVNLWLTGRILVSCQAFLEVCVVI